MKITPKKLFYVGMEALFMVAVPIAVTIIRFVHIDDIRIKIGVPGLITAILIFYIVRKTLFRKVTESLKVKIAYLSAQLAVETDSQKLLNIVKCLKTARVKDALLGSIAPIGLLSAAVLILKAIESGIAALSGVLGLILLSVIAGTVFSMLSAATVITRKGDKNEN